MRWTFGIAATLTLALALATGYFLAMAYMDSLML